MNIQEKCFQPCTTFKASIMIYLRKKIYTHSYVTFCLLKWYKMVGIIINSIKVKYFVSKLVLLKLTPELWDWQYNLRYIWYTIYLFFIWLNLRLIFVFIESQQFTQCLLKGRRGMIDIISWCTKWIISSFNFEKFIILL